jgi:hypothetical protein
MNFYMYTGMFETVNVQLKIQELDTKQSQKRYKAYVDVHVVEKGIPLLKVQSYVQSSKNKTSSGI